MSFWHPTLCLQARRARLAGVVILMFAVVSTAFGQTQGSSKTQPPQTAPNPKVERAPAPPPVAKPPPLVRPKGSVHAQPAQKPAKPGTKGATKPGSNVPASAAAGAVAGAVIAAPAPAAPAEPMKGTATGMLLPRFAALRSDEVNLRTGPGVRYPIDWVYKRRDLPVQIEREFEVWRLVRDQDGVKGWVHQATLTGRRSFVVTGTERALRRQANTDAAAVARLQPGVVGHIRACEGAAEWCQVQVGDYKGWLKRDEFWGILPNEAIN